MSRHSCPNCTEQLCPLYGIFRPREPGPWLLSSHLHRAVGGRIRTVITKGTNQDQQEPQGADSLRTFRLPWCEEAAPSQQVSKDLMTLWSVFYRADSCQNWTADLSSSFWPWNIKWHQLTEMPAFTWEPGGSKQCFGSGLLGSWHHSIGSAALCTTGLDTFAPLGSLAHSPRTAEPSQAMCSYIFCKLDQV